MQQWLGKYQDTAVQYAQQGYDQIQDYVRSNFNDYVEANNLTQVVHGPAYSLSELAQAETMMGLSSLRALSPSARKAPSPSTCSQAA